MCSYAQGIIVYAHSYKKDILTFILCNECPSNKPYVLSERALGDSLMSKQEDM